MYLVYNPRRAGSNPARPGHRYAGLTSPVSINIGSLIPAYSGKNEWLGKFDLCAICWRFVHPKSAFVYGRISFYWQFECLTTARWPRQYTSLQELVYLFHLMSTCSKNCLIILSMQVRASATPEAQRFAGSWESTRFTSTRSSGQGFHHEPLGNKQSRIKWHRVLCKFQSPLWDRNYSLRMCSGFPDYGAKKPRSTTCSRSTELERKGWNLPQALLLHRSIDLPIGWNPSFAGCAHQY